MHHGCGHRPFLDGLAAIIRFSAYLPIVIARNQAPQSAPHDRVVIGDKNSFYDLDPYAQSVIFSA